MNGKQLLEQLNSGSAATFDVYIKKWSPRIYYCSLSISDSPEIAKRLVVDVFTNFCLENKYTQCDTNVERILLESLIRCSSSEFYGLIKDSSPLEHEIKLEHLWELGDDFLSPDIDKDKFYSDIRNDIYNAAFFYQSHSGKNYLSFINLRLQKFISCLLVIFFPIVFITFGYYIYRSNLTLGNNLMISTGMDITSITLPDGSKIRMQKNSDLYYDNRLYNMDERRIEFNGRGNFIVINSEKVFTLLTDFTRIEANQAHFSLCADKASNNTSLSVKVGNVSISSLSRKEKYNIRQGEMAVVDHEKGDINVQNIPSLRRGKSVVRSVP